MPTETKQLKSRNERDARYRKLHTKEFKLRLNLNTDTDILAKLSTIDNFQGYIKSLIRADIEASKQS